MIVSRASFAYDCIDSLYRITELGFDFLEPFLYKGHMVDVMVFFGLVATSNDNDAMNDILVFKLKESLVPFAKIVAEILHSVSLLTAFEILGDWVRFFRRTIQAELEDRKTYYIAFNLVTETVTYLDKSFIRKRNINTDHLNGCLIACPSVVVDTQAVLDGL